MEEPKNICREGLLCLLPHEGDLIKKEGEETNVFYEILGALHLEDGSGVLAVRRVDFSVRLVENRRVWHYESLIRAGYMIVEIPLKMLKEKKKE